MIKITRMEDIPPFAGIVEASEGRVCALAMNDETALILQDGNLPEAFALREKLINSNRYLRVRIREADPGLLNMLLQQYQARESSLNNEEDTKLQSEFLQMVADAMRQGASDVHIELHSLQAKVRFRIHGRLKEVMTWSFDYAHRLSGVAFAVTAEELDGVTFNPRAPQFALVDKVINGTRVRLRLNSIPASPDGYDVIIRILPIGQEQGKVSVRDLGYDRQQELLIRSAMAQPSGVLVVSGTTGSGKSTSLNVLLSEKIRNEPSLKLITIEDPPEYFISGATQVPVTRRGDAGASAFAATMRAVMRCDPDIIMVGEVRDEETAKLLQQATLTGHKTLTTLHTAGVITIIQRLEQLGVERPVMGSKGFFSGLIYQRLLGITCPHCAVPLNDKIGATEIGIRRLGDEAAWKAALMRWDFVARKKGLRINDVSLASVDGCKKCSHGSNGRTVVAEVLIPDEKMLEMIGEGRDGDLLKHWRRNGGLTVVEHALNKVIEGTVCPLVAEAGVGPLSASIVADDGYLADMGATLLPIEVKA